MLHYSTDIDGKGNGMAAAAERKGKDEERISYITSHSYLYRVLIAFLPSDAAFIAMTSSTLLMLVGWKPEF